MPLLIREEAGVVSEAFLVVQCFWYSAFLEELQFRNRIQIIIGVNQDLKLRPSYHIGASTMRESFDAQGLCVQDRGGQKIIASVT